MVIIAICSEIPIKQTNALCWQKVEFLNVTIDASKCLKEIGRTAVFELSIWLFAKQGEGKFKGSKRNYLSLAWHHGEAKMAINLQLKRTVQYRRHATWRGFSGVLRLYLYSVALCYLKSKLMSIFWVEMCVHLYMELVSWLQVREVEWCLPASTVTGYVRNVHLRHRLCCEQQMKTGVSRTLQLLCSRILLEIRVLISSVFTNWYFLA